MQTFKPSGAELARLHKLAVELQEANDSSGAAKKTADASKEGLSKWLKEQRGFDVDQMKIGEVVCIEGIAIIERGKQNRLDTKKLLAEEPELHAKFSGEQPITKYRPLV